MDIAPQGYLLLANPGSQYCVRGVYDQPPSKQHLHLPTKAAAFITGDNCRRQPGPGRQGSQKSLLMRRSIHQVSFWDIHTEGAVRVAETRVVPALLILQVWVLERLGILASFVPYVAGGVWGSDRFWCQDPSDRLLCSHWIALHRSRLMGRWMTAQSLHSGSSMLAMIGTSRHSSFRLSSCWDGRRGFQMGLLEILRR